MTTPIELKNNDDTLTELKKITITPLIKIKNNNKTPLTNILYYYFSDSLSKGKIAISLI